LETIVGVNEGSEVGEAEWVLETGSGVGEVEDGNGVLVTVELGVKETGSL
jgi:hypothetical protein